MSAPVPPSPRPTVTHVDVARRAGVSTAVVSYVVNNGPRQVARRHRSSSARSHRGARIPPEPQRTRSAAGHPDLIGLVVPDSSNPFFAELAQGIEQAAAQRGYSMVLVNSNNSGEQERLKVESLANRRVSGLLVATALPRHETRPRGPSWHTHRHHQHRWTDAACWWLHHVPWLSHPFPEQSGFVVFMFHLLVQLHLDIEAKVGADGMEKLTGIGPSVLMMAVGMP